MSQLIKIVFILPAILCSLLIFILSHQEQVHIPIMDFTWGDKIMHFIAYFGLHTAYMMAAISIFNDKSLKIQRLSSIFMATLFAISDEYHQSFVPGRSSEFYDFLADFIGILISSFFFNLIQNLYYKYSRK